MKLLKRVCSVALGFALTPFAGAMIASVNGTAGHNTDPTKDFQGNAPSEAITEIWNRTVTLGAGTGTYLGNFGGTRWVLTAAHVSSVSGTIKTADGRSLVLGDGGKVYTGFKNADGTSVDLKLFSVSATGDAADYLDALGNIEIYTGDLYTNTPLYCVGTGCSLSLGGGISSGSRVKQWGEFCADGIQEVEEGGRKTLSFVEVFSSEAEKSIQCGMYDSGSGVFVKNGENWEVVGVAITVGANSENNPTVGYVETPNSICVTSFTFLPEYASQIYAIIPEPSVFGLLAGIFALGFAGTRRKRK